MSIDFESAADGDTSNHMHMISILSRFNQKSLLVGLCSHKRMGKQVRMHKAKPMKFSFKP